VLLLLLLFFWWMRSVLKHACTVLDSRIPWNASLGSDAKLSLAVVAAVASAASYWRCCRCCCCSLLPLLLLLCLLWPGTSFVRIFEHFSNKKKIMQ